MKAVRLLEYGGLLVVFNDVPTPTIARDEILVKIKNRTTLNHKQKEIESWSAS